MRLNDDQRRKLIERRNLNPDFDVRKRRENEFAIRNHLRSFLEFVPDANLILDKLPRNQLKDNEKLARVLNDDSIKGIFSLTLKLLDLLDFMPIEGEPRKPYVTKILSEKPGDVIARKATEIDFERNRLVNNYVELLTNFYQTDFNLLLKYELARVVKNREEMKAELEKPHIIEALNSAGITPNQYVLFLSQKKAIESSSK